MRSCEILNQNEKKKIGKIQLGKLSARSDTIYIYFTGECLASCQL